MTIYSSTQSDASSTPHPQEPNNQATHKGIIYGRSVKVTPENSTTAKSISVASASSAAATVAVKSSSSSAAATVAVKSFSTSARLSTFIYNLPSFVDLPHQQQSESEYKIYLSLHQRMMTMHKKKPLTFQQWKNKHKENQKPISYRTKIAKAKAKAKAKERHLFNYIPDIQAFRKGMIHLQIHLKEMMGELNYKTKYMKILNASLSNNQRKDLSRLLKEFDKHIFSEDNPNPTKQLTLTDKELERLLSILDFAYTNLVIRFSPFIQQAKNTKYYKSNFLHRESKFTLLWTVRRIFCFDDNAPWLYR